MVFPVVMYGSESWTVKKAECRRVDAFELWCWRRLLRVPWTARRSSQSILKEISPGYSLEGLMLKLKLQYFGHLMQRADSLEKILIWEGLGAGGEGDNRRWDGWMASPTRWTWVWVDSGSWWWTGRPGMLRFLGSQRVRHDWVTELNWTVFLGGASPFALGLGVSPHSLSSVYHLTGVFLTLDLEYLYMAIPAKCNHHSWPWQWGISSWPLAAPALCSRHYAHTLIGLPRCLSGKESVCQTGDMGSIPKSGRSPGEGNGNPLQYFWLGNPTDRRAWRATVHVVANSLKQLSN